MLKRNKFWLSAVLVAGLALPAFAEEPTADTVVATVNGEKITVGHVLAVKASLPEQYQALPDDVLFTGLVEQLIQQVALSQSLKGEVPLRIKLTAENELNAQRAGYVMDQKLRAAITDEAIQAAYDERYANMEPETEYNASHILVETEDEAKAIKKQLDEGADFAELAKEKSTGPSGPNGGSLGWFGKGMMVKPFEDAVVTMKAGEISDPVQTQFGWHVLILNETRMKDAPPLEEVKGELEAEIQQKLVEQIMADATKGAEITRADEETVPASVLSHPELIDN
ncbi:peptidylprolyl isomerase [Profundibacter amoris]|uniref:Parvulin-like PPIase n=1 Tax=Profundibacter amoris TaxID=2171755 RepID=A0A347UKX0_9RHOB|nr:peptidylprolyl isomerase [Profundibacter amoris]AXX99498.1 peptidylprolyl isomerase [Profundibacter amoris]